MGILCRHAFRILMTKDVCEIPERYILRRWRKDVISSRYHLIMHGCDELDGEFAKQISLIYSSIGKCLDFVRDDKEKMSLLVDKIQVILKEFEVVSSKKIEMMTKTDLVTKVMGVSIPENVIVQVPTVQRNKGCGTKKRIPSQFENVSQNSKRGSRICSGCNLYVPHNYRTCPVRIAADEAKKNNS